MFQYVIFDVFNIDETNLFYRIEPNCIVAIKKLFGKMNKKEYMIAAFIANVDGTIKLLPLIINKCIEA